MTIHHLELEDVLFVATDLTILSDQATPATVEDVDIEGRIYRPLDPAYYAWLRTRMERAQAAFRKGKLSTEAFETLRSRFNRLHDQAVALFGEELLLEAVQSLDPKTYPVPGKPPADKPPVGSATKPEVAPSPSAPIEGWSKHAFPAADPHRFHFNQRVTNHAVAQVDAIRDQALALGWTEAEIYQTRGRFAFPCGRHYGLVCFIHRDQHIGEVTTASIAIVNSEGHALRFYRYEVTA